MAAVVNVLLSPHFSPTRKRQSTKPMQYNSGNTNDNSRSMPATADSAKNVFVEILLVLSEIANAFMSLFDNDKDPKRYAADKAPKGWHRAVRNVASETGTAFRVESDGEVYYAFSDKEFDLEVKIEPDLTEQDRIQLAKRKLNPENEKYAQAKRLYAQNPGITKTMLHEHIPSVKAGTFKDVLAAFREAKASPIGGGGVVDGTKARGNVVEFEI